MECSIALTYRPFQNRTRSFEPHFGSTEKPIKLYDDELKIDRKEFIEKNYWKTALSSKSSKKFGKMKRFIAAKENRNFQSI